MMPPLFALRRRPLVFLAELLFELFLLFVAGLPVDRLFALLFIVDLLLLVFFVAMLIELRASPSERTSHFIS